MAKAVLPSTRRWQPGDGRPGAAAHPDDTREAGEQEGGPERQARGGHPACAGHGQRRGQSDGQEGRSSHAGGRAAGRSSHAEA
eukprot:2525798-Pyramimonas_sp.AAC.1